ncbi:AAA family ATPase [Paucibacter sp. R3-3]|uniref:AAA family ATPase n=1 Tax=Roseateles agri TaxID=3098619 RepID=A0ABU5DNQ8_9BURK|nr:AAA family ATPase [Paucibacter sp. R3-3]MDY0747955.1 AAA family ATPase [Paucibacter sp. R3-3]
MIHQIDIGQFGSFGGFQWKAVMKDGPGNAVQNFKKLNIIYGRNYSGKTTLSRVFRSLETGQIPWKHEGANFSVRGEHGELSHQQIAGQPYDIRVYNKDFVAEHLSFLTDQRDGDVRTFAIVGGENNALAERIATLRQSLGSVDEKRGARYEASQAADKHAKATKRASDAKDALDEAMRRQANDVIKKDRAFGHAGYNIESIKADIAQVVAKKIGVLTEADRTTFVTLLKEEALPEVRETAAFRSKLHSLFEEASPLITRPIEPTKPLKDLLEDASLEVWVREGIGHHQGKRDGCAFCRQTLPSDLWQTLSEHFNQASETLAHEIDSCLAKVREEEKSISVMPSIESGQLYASERAAFDKAKALLAKAAETYQSDVAKLASALANRRASLFRIGRLPLFDFDPASADAAVQALNEAVAASNRRSSTLNKDKEAARVSLRQSKVAEFLATLDLPAKQANIESLREKSGDAKTAAETSREAERKIEQEIKQLEAQQKDERKGAERVNALLNHYFGHGGVRLEAVDDAGASGVKFQIMRGERPAFNLSEGEGSLIAFCYFMARLDALGTGGKELIVYIDDPISSLDSNHVFFVYGLIEQLLCAPFKKSDGTDGYKYKQLFVSTHNLDFLKYLKRLTGSDKQHFIIERHGETASRLSLMPAYLKKYVTEFNYLFHQIHKCSLAAPQGGDHDHFFSFGNNLRKFLEAYLYFKYPHGTGRDAMGDRVAKFFAGDEMAGKIASRLGNELSHLEESFERGMAPIDIPEIQKIAAHVIAKIQTADQAQYEALMASIGATP